MEGIYSHLSVRMGFGFLLLMLLQSSTEAQVCTGPAGPVSLDENNEIGDVVVTITVQEGVTLSFRSQPSDNAFTIQGNQILANKVFDYETMDQKTVSLLINCNAPDSTEFPIVVTVLIQNVNDNPPVFSMSQYNTNIKELSPIGMTVDTYRATDLDLDQLYYSLTSGMDHFRLQDQNNPVLLVNSLIDYDKIKEVRVTLEVQDTPPGVATDPSHTAATTIVVTINDDDNRPPWFQPCTVFEVNGAKICPINGYTGTVMQHEQEVGPLTLEPGPVSAIDGDNGINEEISYSFVNGENGGGLFEINSDTGSITMLKAAELPGTITLTVLAAQKWNAHQFATTTVTMTVVPNSLHPPRFQKDVYNGVVTAVGAMAIESGDTGTPVHIVATDEDFAASEGINPAITYSITGNSNFLIINGYLFMIQELPDSTLALEVVATDTETKETDTTTVNVEVKLGLTTTTLPPSTTDVTATTPTKESTTGDTKPTTNPTTATEGSNPTTNPTTATEGSNPTTNPTTATQGSNPTTNPTTATEGSNPTTATDGSNPTTNPTTATEGSNPTTATEGSNPTTNPTTATEGSKPTTNPVSTAPFSVSTEDGTQTTKPTPTNVGGVSTASTAPPHTVVPPPGGYGPGDMAAVGATLGILLLICIVVIVVLALQVRRGKSDWKKIYETSVFRSTMGQGSGGPKESIQYTNDAFVNDEDQDGGKDFELEEAMAKNTVSLHALLNGDLGQEDFDNNDKEVKPILTRERRLDDGYKSVWFKEDIDPNAKEEVVIIPDSREDHDSDEDDDETSSNGREENEEDSLRMKAPRAVFNEADLDSGLGVRVEDQGEDSEDEEGLTVSL